MNTRARYAFELLLYLVIGCIPVALSWTSALDWRFWATIALTGATVVKAKLSPGSTEEKK